MNFSAAPITFILIAINVIVSLIGFSNADVIDKTIMWPYGIKREKQYYRFISSGFIHADFIHLLFNMFSFYFFGTAIEFYFSQYFPFCFSSDPRFLHRIPPRQNVACLPARLPTRIAALGKVGQGR